MTQTLAKRVAVGALAGLGAGCISIDSYEQPERSAGRPGPVRFENPRAVAPPVGAYSHVAVVPEGGELIAIAGQVGLTLDGSLASTPEAQFEQALSNVLRIVESQGGSSQDIVKLTMYVVQGERGLNYDRLHAIRAALLGDAKPASTLVYVSGLARPEYLVEVEAWAVRRKR